MQALLAEVHETPIYAWVVEHNAGSIRVLEKAGFIFDRREDDHLVYKVDA